ncbi:MAG: hypothetical protein DWQ06_06740 [Calditrichaeota bacterium]|nr:MAG: hypothetical protein DWQ06_06740 [Calditrichota bacterium]
MFLIQFSSAFAAELKLEEISGNQPYFFTDVIAFKNIETSTEDEVRLEIFLKLPYDSIQFLKKKDSFEAKCEIAFTVLDKNGEQLGGHVTQKNIQAKTYRETNSIRNSIIYFYAFDIPSLDEYTIRAAVTDSDSKAECVQRYTLKNKFAGNKKIQISDLVYTDKVAMDSLHEISHFRPSVIRNFDDKLDKYFLYYEIYNNTDENELDVSYLIRAPKTKGAIIDSTFKVIAETGKIKRQVIELPSDSLHLGEYSIELKISNSKARLNYKKPIQIRWRQIPFSISNLTEAIEQLRYIAPNKEYQKIQKADEIEQKELFQEFWKKRDPTDGTALNEIMLEYYRRVEHSNKNFSNVTPGWKTDRGMVYILFGPPSDVEDHSFEANSRPYLVWYYYSLGRKFTFVDFRGFGDYELLEPLSSFDTYFNN